MSLGVHGRLCAGDLMPLSRNSSDHRGESSQDSLRSVLSIDYTRGMDNIATNARINIKLDVLGFLTEVDDLWLIVMVERGSGSPDFALRSTGGNQEVLEWDSGHVWLRIGKNLSVIQEVLHLRAELLIVHRIEVLEVHIQASTHEDGLRRVLTCHEE